MEVTILKNPSDSDWMEVKRRALVTIGKSPVNLPSLEWKESILLARHSPIRSLQFSFLLKDIPYYQSVHLVRHIHAQPYVKSQRNDRQDNYDRNKAPQDSPVDMIWDMNAEELLIIANKRLCNQASKETQEVIRQICELVKVSNPEFKRFLVPNCVLCGGHCPEMKPCGWNKTIECRDMVQTFWKDK